MERNICVLRLMIIYHGLLHMRVTYFCCRVVCMTWSQPESCGPWTLEESRWFVDTAHSGVVLQSSERMIFIIAAKTQDPPRRDNTKNSKTHFSHLGSRVYQEDDSTMCLQRNCSSVLKTWVKYERTTSHRSVRANRNIHQSVFTIYSKG